jgi:hypothetical protein
MSKNTNLSFLTDYITADIINGRIGINNASPTVAFDVSGATKISGALTLTGALSGTSATFSDTISITANNSNAYSLNLLGRSVDNATTLNFFSNNGVTRYGYIYTEPTTMLFGVSGATRLAIASTGAATFSSSAAGYGITLNHTSENLRLKMGAIAGGVINIQGEVISSSAVYPIVLNNLGGNIGIGASTSPTYLLEVSTAGGSQRIRVGTLQNNNNTSTFEAITTQTISTASSGWFRANAGGTMSIGTSSYTKAGGDSGNFANLSAEVQTTAMTITSAGNVGIGTTTPGVKLEVNGGGAAVAMTIATSGATTAGCLWDGGGAPSFHAWSRPDDCGIGSNNFAGKSILIKTGMTYGSFTTGTTRIEIQSSGAVVIPGSLSKGSGSFRIDHPLKPDTHQLVHSFIEGPQADLIYRGKLTLINGKAQANIDEVSTMTEGTFEALCREVQCFTTNENGWDLVKGKVIGNIIYIESQNPNSTDEISWMVIGERKDKHMMDTEWTDEQGKVIVEPLKQK